MTPSLLPSCFRLPKILCLLRQQQSFPQAHRQQLRLLMDFSKLLTRKSLLVMPVDGFLRESSMTAIFDALTLALDLQQPHSFIDLGCGTMRPTIAFRQYCVDHQLPLPPYDLEVEVMRERYFVGIRQLLWARKHLPYLFSSPPCLSCVCCDIQHLQSLGAHHDHAIVWIFNHVWIEMAEVMTHIAQLVKSQGGNHVEWIVCGNEMQTYGFDLFRFYMSIPGKMAAGKEQRTLYIYHHIPPAAAAANSVTATATVDSPSTASATGQDSVVLPLQDWDVLDCQLRAWQNDDPVPRRALLRAGSNIHHNVSLSFEWMFLKETLSVVFFPGFRTRFIG